MIKKQKEILVIYSEEKDDDAAVNFKFDKEFINFLLAVNNDEEVLDQLSENTISIIDELKETIREIKIKKEKIKAQEDDNAEKVAEGYEEYYESRDEEQASET